jgi:hypothetical protein
MIKVIKYVMGAKGKSKLFETLYRGTLGNKLFFDCYGVNTWAKDIDVLQISPEQLEEVLNHYSTQEEYNLSTVFIYGNFALTDVADLVESYSDKFSDIWVSIQNLSERITIAFK